MYEDAMFDNLIESVDVPINRTATITGSAIDLFGYEGCKVSVHFGNSADTLAAGLNWDCKIQESTASGSGFTDVAAVDVVGNTSNQFGLVNAPTEDQEIYSLGYKGKLRYIRVIVTATGSHSSGTPIGITAVKIPVDRPVTQAVNP